MLVAAYTLTSRTKRIIVSIDDGEHWTPGADVTDQDNTWDGHMFAIGAQRFVHPNVGPFAVFTGLSATAVIALSKAVPVVGQPLAITPLTWTRAVADDFLS
jgi:hypothetical protein